MAHDERMSTPNHRTRPYWMLAAALALSLAVMYLLTFAMINTWNDFYFNLSNLYMALIMVFPMGIVMIALMWRMFPNRRLNIGLLVAFAAAFGAAFWMGRTETFIGNEQFLDSMIPHHSRAILVCEQSDITDAEIQNLCQEIIDSQQAEINQMKQIMTRLQGTTP